jgi:flagellar motor protein MotB
MKMDRILAAIGYADTQPIVGNISEAYRVRNRRVDIVIEQPAPEGA